MSARDGPLFHMTFAQLAEFAKCKNISLPPGQKPTKSLYVALIREKLGGQEHTKSKPGTAGSLHMADVGPSDMQFGSSGDCVEKLAKFGVDRAVQLPNPDRLWNTVVGFPKDASNPGIAVWNGTTSNSTLVAQYLAGGEIFLQMWKLGDRPKLVPWANSKLRVRGESVRVQDQWDCVADDGNTYAFAKFKGIWDVSLEALASMLMKLNLARGASEFQLATVLTLVVEKALADNPDTTIGRDTQHYAWRFEKLPTGEVWLVVGLVPFAYLPQNPERPYPPVPVDALVRTALAGVGGVYLKESVITLA